MGGLATHLGTDVRKTEQNGRGQDVSSVQAREGTRRLLTESRSLHLFRANKTRVTLSSQEPCALLGGGCCLPLVPGRRTLVHLRQPQGPHSPRSVTVSGPAMDAQLASDSRGGLCWGLVQKGRIARKRRHVGSTASLFCWPSSRLHAMPRTTSALDPAKMAEETRTWFQLSCR